MKSIFCTAIILLASISAYAQDLGLYVHQGGKMMVHGGTGNQLGAIDPANSITTRVLGNVTIGRADDVLVSELGARNSGELVIDGNLVKNQRGVASFLESDVVFRIATKNQAIIGDFSNTNSLYNVVINKQTDNYLAIHNEVALKNKLVMQGNGFVKTSDGTSNTLGKSYPGMLTLMNSNVDAIVSNPVTPGSKDNVIEGRLQWNTVVGKTYTFPVSADRNDSRIGGAQLLQFTPNTGSGYVIASFNKDAGGRINAVSEQCKEKDSRNVIDHGYWNISNPSNTIKDYNLGARVNDGLGISPSSFFTLVKKPDGAPISSYALDGIDPNNCQGYAINGFINRNNYTSFSDVAVAELFNVTAGNFVPNLITPNGDNKNDEWDLSVLTRQYPNLKVAIYNRWGNMVYRSIGTYKNDWDGTHYNGEILPDGVYYYLIELSPEYSQTQSGFIQISRN